MMAVGLHPQNPDHQPANAAETRLFNPRTSSEGGRYGPVRTIARRPVRRFRRRKPEPPGPPKRGSQRGRRSINSWVPPPRLQRWATIVAFRFPLPAGCRRDLLAQLISDHFGCRRDTLTMGFHLRQTAWTTPTYPQDMFQAVPSLISYRCITPVQQGHCFWR